MRCTCELCTERARKDQAMRIALRDALMWMGQRTDDTEERRRIIAAGWAALEASSALLEEGEGAMAERERVRELVQ